MADKAQTLRDFAAEARSARRPRCATCIHPLRDEIEAGRRNGVSLDLISGWLRKYHPDQWLAPNSLRNHFVNGHQQS